MRIAGVRVSIPFVRLLAQMVEDAGYPDTAGRLAEAIRLQVMEAPLTIEDHEAILDALETRCPSGLARLRSELVEDRLRRGAAGL